MSEDYEARIHEFNIELELMIASMLLGVPITEINKFYGSDNMAAIVAKVFRTYPRARRR